MSEGHQASPIQRVRSTVGTDAPAQDATLVPPIDALSDDELLAGMSDNLKRYLQARKPQLMAELAANEAEVHELGPDTSTENSVETPVAEVEQVEQVDQDEREQQELAADDAVGEGEVVQTDVESVTEELVANAEVETALPESVEEVLDGECSESGEVQLSASESEPEEEVESAQEASSEEQVSVSVEDVRDGVSEESSAEELLSPEATEIESNSGSEDPETESLDEAPYPDPIENKSLVETGRAEELVDEVAANIGEAQEALASVEASQGELADGSFASPAEPSPEENEESAVLLEAMSEDLFTLKIDGEKFAADKSTSLESFETQIYEVAPGSTVIVDLRELEGVSPMTLGSLYNFQEQHVSVFAGALFLRLKSKEEYPEKVWTRLESKFSIYEEG